ncbi:MAG: orotate phosphoribosyltransferase [Mycobacteriaceae bacterium]|nr:orotate phosphoribosyltransferase [Mycobacteriaceae bacterium]
MWTTRDARGQLRGITQILCPSGPTRTQTIQIPGCGTGGPRTIAPVTSWQAAFDVIKRGHEYRDVPFKLASGQTSHHYIDGKHAVDTGERLTVVCRAIVELTTEHQIEFDAVGGLTMGADALAHGVAMVTGKAWFSVRKEPKSRGLEQFIEGFRLRDHPGTRVLLVEDVVSTGGSVCKAYDRSIEAGAVVTGIVTMVDRGDLAARIFAERGAPYFPLVTYEHLGIEPITHE